MARAAFVTGATVGGPAACGAGPSPSTVPDIGASKVRDSQPPALAAEWRLLNTSGLQKPRRPGGFAMPHAFAAPSPACAPSQPRL
jgi:hypothetical protein